jgi:hypothetical protein
MNPLFMVLTLIPLLLVPLVNAQNLTSNNSTTQNQTLPLHGIYQSPHTLVLKGDLQIPHDLKGIWVDVDTAKTQGYKITSVAIDSYTAALPGSTEPSLFETVLVVMEK